MTATSRYIAGSMSGTSADGVDIAIVAVDGRGLDMTAQLVVHHHRPYNEQLRRQIFAFRGDEAGSVSQSTLRKLADLGREISLTYAAAVNEALAAAHMESKNLAAVAAHGQTLFHDPPNTIQWLDPSLIAAEVGCAVVSDFRRADLAAGGQGAPLVPFADYILFRHQTQNRVLLNIGGIANLTYLPAGGGIEDVVAFDTGPGNCISDHLCRAHDPTGPGYDVGGSLALSGRENSDVVANVLFDPYFRRAAPKSTDGPAMIRLFEDALDGSGVRETLSLPDLLATACSVTSLAVHFALVDLGDVDLILASGGGVENSAILRNLSYYPTPIEIVRESQAKEAIAFALLAAATLDGVPANLPRVTGARKPVLLGSITPRP